MQLLHKPQFSWISINRQSNSDFWEASCKHWHSPPDFHLHCVLPNCDHIISYFSYLKLFDMIPPTFWCMNFEIAKKISTFKMKYSLCGVESEYCSILNHSQDLDFSVSLCLVTHNFLSNIPFAYFYIIMSEWHSILFFIVCLASQAPSYCRKVVHIIIIINIIITPT